MSTKTIITTVTLVGAKGEEYVPGTPVALPAEEADRILERFGGEVVTKKAKAAEGDDGDTDTGGEPKPKKGKGKTADKPEGGDQNPSADDQKPAN